MLRCLCASAPLKLMTKSQQIKWSLVLWWEGKLENLEKNFLENQLTQPIIIMRPFEFLILSAGRINKDLSAKLFLLDCSAKTVFFFFHKFFFSHVQIAVLPYFKQKMKCFMKKKPNLQERDSVANHWKYSLVTEPWVQFLSGTLKIVPVVADRKSVV